MLYNYNQWFIMMENVEYNAEHRHYFAAIDVTMMKRKENRGLASPSSIWHWHNHQWNNCRDMSLARYQLHWVLILIILCTTLIHFYYYLHSSFTITTYSKMWLRLWHSGCDLFILMWLLDLIFLINYKDLI